MEHGARGWTGGRAPVGVWWAVSMDRKVKAKSSFFHFSQPFGTRQTDKEGERLLIFRHKMALTEGVAVWVVRLFTSGRERRKR